MELARILIGISPEKEPIGKGSIMNIQFNTTGEFRDFLANHGADLGADEFHGDHRWRKLARQADDLLHDLSLQDDGYGLQPGGESFMD